MPRYQDRPKEDREDRERYDRKRKGRSDDEAEGSKPYDRDRSRSRNSNSNRNERNYRDDRNGRNDRYNRNDRNPRNERNDRNDTNDRRERNQRFNKNNRYNRNEPRKSSFLEATLKNEPSPEWGRRNPKEEGDADKKPVEKEKPNFGLSGKLTEDMNTVNGIVIKYSEPSNARKPNRRWRLYPFKGEKALPTLYVHRQSAYLMGRDRKIADIPLDHPSCSKQHAVLQYRLVNFQRENGTEGKRIRPYIIDLESANGTYVNNVKIEPTRYHELLERDVLKFGFSSREYVMLHEHSRDEELDDDVATAAGAET